MTTTLVVAQNVTDKQTKPVLRDVTVGVPESFPPYYQLDANGRPFGFAIDTMNEVAKRAGLKVTYRVKKSWNDVFDALRSGDIDIVPSLGITDSRKESFAFTVPLETFGISIFVRDDSENLTTINDFSGRSIAVVSSNAAHRILNSRDDIQLHVFENFTEALFALLSAKVDAIAYPAPVAWKKIREARVEAQIKVVGEPLQEIKRAIAVQKSNSELLAILDAVVREFVVSPEYRHLYVKWFGSPKPYWTVVRVSWIMGIGLAFVLMVMGWWRYYSIIGLNKRIHDREEHFRRVFEDSGVAMTITELDGRFRRVNKSMCDMLGYSQEELLAMSIFDITHSDDLAQTDKDRKKLLYLRLDSELYEKRYHHKDGSVVWGSIVRSVVRDNYGDPQYIVSQIQNVTARRRTEEQLRLSETRLSTAQKLVKLGYFEHDVLSEESYWSDMVCDMFGFEHGELVSLEKFLNHIHPDDQEKIKASVDKFVETGGTYSAEYRILKTDGEERIIRNVALSIASDKGRVTKYVGAVLDVTEERQREDQLRQAQKMEAVGQLTGGVAHDFNNLLAIMIGNTELMEDYVGDDENVRHHLDEIKQAVDSASYLTNRLLAFSRKQTLLAEVTDIKGLVDGLGDMLRRTLGETINFKAEHAANLWLATIDPHQFENALVNLALNARDAMMTGGTLTIETANVTLDKTYIMQNKAVNPGDYIRVAVSDTGDGIVSEILDNVFEPFFTTKEVGQGSGLGLSMVYGFVKQSGGHITIYSEVGFGTTLKLYFPRSQETIEQKDGIEEAVKFELGSERILVVEDDSDVRKISVKILRKQGYDIVETKDGAEAIAHLENGQVFDLLFTDVVLPGNLNGVEVADVAKRLQPDIKVLYTSGYAENAIEHSGKLVPGVTLVNKPYLRSELLKKVRAILDSENG